MNDQLITGNLTVLGNYNVNANPIINGNTFTITDSIKDNNFLIGTNAGNAQWTILKGHSFRITAGPLSYTNANATVTRESIYYVNMQGDTVLTKWVQLPEGKIGTKFVIGHRDPYNKIDIKDHLGTVMTSTITGPSMTLLYCRDPGKWFWIKQTGDY